MIFSRSEAKFLKKLDYVAKCIAFRSSSLVMLYSANYHNLILSTFWKWKCRHLLFLIKTFLLTALPRPRPLFGFDYNFVCLFCWYYFNLWRNRGESLDRKVRLDYIKVTFTHFNFTKGRISALHRLAPFAFQALSFM